VGPAGQSNADLGAAGDAYDRAVVETVLTEFKLARQREKQRRCAFDT